MSPSLMNVPHDAQHDIIDIRSDTAGIELQHEILVGLKCEREKEKTLPTLLLYDEEGLKLFERITYLDEYYLTGEEISVLQKHADSITQCIPHGAMLVELGSGYALPTGTLPFLGTPSLILA